MSADTDTHVLLRAFVEELARCGMRAACTSPGSRNTPLVLALAGERRLRCYSHVDERCAGFFALGTAKASGLPVAVTCTSGTAVAGLLPAAIEAHEARVPLLLLTADRPPELRENGAGQAIDQLKIFGGAVKWFFEVGTHEASPERLRWMRTLACRAYWSALEGRPGAVHLNFPLREPLVSEDELPTETTARADGRPYVARPASRARLEEAAERELRELVLGARRGVLVAGRHERDTPLGQAAAEFARAAGWPLLADPLSGARRGEAAIAHYDALLREGSFADWARPDLVLRVGDLPVSKPLRGWLAGLDGVRQLAFDPEGAWQDPSSVLSDSLAIEPVEGLARLTAELAQATARQRDAGQRDAGERDAGERDAGEDWLSSWRSADALAAEAIQGALAGEGLTEPAVASELGVLLAAEATLFVASSMPVRDIESFWPAREDPPRTLCNRGANGIDGTVSAAFGAAAAAAIGAGDDDDGDGEPARRPGPVVLLIGDVALAHDIGGLLAARRTGLKITIVLIDNDGGGIFDFLAIARTSMASPETYSAHVATPTGLDFERAAGLYGLTHERVEDLAGFRMALERALAQEHSAIVEVRGERTDNVELHARVWQAVSRALNPRSAH